MKKAKEEIGILEVSKGYIDLCVIGTTGYICNRLSEKAKHQLLMPGRKKNMMERATTLKHDPVEEFRSSPYKFNDDNTKPTLLCLPSASFKKAMMTAALDLPDTKKAVIGRLTWVEGLYTPIYGVPEILTSVVRSADMNRTPDIRSRAIVREWACRLNVSFVKPLIQVEAIFRLMNAAGMFIGVGDWRNEKASGTFGSFMLTHDDDPEFQRIISAGGRAAQIEAMQTPVAYDEETASLLSWYNEERERRQGKGVA